MTCDSKRMKLVHYREIRCGIGIGFCLRQMLFVAVILLAGGSTVWSMNGITVRRWGGADGLSENSSWNVTSGITGNVWVMHGKNEFSCFDGYAIKLVDVASPEVCREGSDGVLWTLLRSLHAGAPPSPDRGLSVGPSVQLYGFGLSDGGNWMQYPISELSVHKISTFHDLISSRFLFLPLSQHQLIYVLSDALMLFDADTEENIILKKAEDTELGRFIHLAPGNQGVFWITGTGGVAEFRMNAGNVPAIGEWSEFLIEASYQPVELMYPREGRDGELFVTAQTIKTNEHTLLRHSVGQWSVLFESGGVSVEGWRGPDGRVWMLQDGSLLLLNSDLPREIENDVYAVDAAPDGSFWCSSIRSLTRYSAPLWTTPKEVADFDSNVTAIHEDSYGRLWFLASKMLILKEGDSWKRFPLPNDLETDKFLYSALCTLPDGRVILPVNERERIGTRLWLFDPQRECFITVPHPEMRVVQPVAPKADGKVWIVSGPQGPQYPNRLESFDGERFEVSAEIPGRNDDHIRTICEIDDGAIWYGTPFQVGRIRGNHLERFNADNGFDETAAFSIVGMNGHTIWVSGRKAILAFDGEKWESIASGIDTRLALCRSRDGSVWAGSWNGLYRHQNGSWVSYTTADGLPSNVVLPVLEDRTGRIWVGSDRGISFYDRETDIDPPRTTIPENLNVKAIAPHVDVHLQFTGMDRWRMTETGRLLYSYRLDGGIWSPFEERTTAVFSGLSAGMHVFEVRAMDRNWNIDSGPAVWEFEVLRPWYQEEEFWFISICGFSMTLFFAGYAVYRHLYLGLLVAKRTADLTRLNERLLAQHERLQNLARELADTEERERRRIATDLHDRIGQALAMCQIQIDALQKRDANNFESKLRELKSAIQQTIQDTQTLVFEISPTILYVLGLEAAVEWLAEEFQAKYGLRIHIRQSGLPVSLNDELRSFLFRAVRELLYNVIKHAGAQNAHVAVERFKEGLRISVEDDGKGLAMDRPQTRGGFGLFSIQERLRLLGGELTIRSELGRGTHVTIDMPLV